MKSKGFVRQVFLFMDLNTIKTCRHLGSNIFHKKGKGVKKDPLSNDSYDIYSGSKLNEDGDFIEIKEYEAINIIGDHNEECE
jgi:hypothetical protein